MSSSSGRRRFEVGVPKVIKEMRSDHLTDQKFRECFDNMRRAGEMCDVAIVVEGHEFMAHKLILSGCSPYFRGMFRYPFPGSNNINVFLIKKCSQDRRL